jgi:hypothetical protein
MAGHPAGSPWSILNKDIAVKCLVGETPPSATESASALLRRDKTVALPETEQNTATFLFKMLQSSGALGWVARPQRPHVGLKIGMKITIKIRNQNPPPNMWDAPIV